MRSKKSMAGVEVLGAAAAVALGLWAPESRADQVMWANRAWYNTTYSNTNTARSNLRIQTNGTAGQFSMNGRTIFQGLGYHDTGVRTQQSWGLNINSTVDDRNQAGTGYHMILQHAGDGTSADPKMNVSFGRFVDSSSYLVDISVWKNGLNNAPERKQVFIDGAAPGMHAMQIQLRGPTMNFMMDGQRVYQETDTNFVISGVTKIYQGGWSDDPSRVLSFMDYSLALRSVPLPSAAGMGFACLGLLAVRRRRRD
jgi:hypothetical protein